MGASREDPSGPTPKPETAAGAAPVYVAELEPGLVVGEYHIERKLGEGGMATVYAAVHPLIGKKAAIKVIAPRLCTDANAVERFVQEARAVNQIGHPNIVDIFAFGALPDGRSYFVMEWLQGETLADRLDAGQLPLRETLAMLFQICDALEAAHEKGIIHRDLKPENVFLVKVRDQRTLVKLLDFGIAKLMVAGASRHSTDSGVILGTPDYVSPEQARGKNVDHRTDVYTFGVMAYEMVLGVLPFNAESAIDVMRMHLTDPPPPPSAIWPDIPPSFERLLLRMLEKNPADRPSLADVRTVLADLRDLTSPTLRKAPPVVPDERPATPGATARHVVPATRRSFVLALCASLVLATGIFFMGRRSVSYSIPTSRAQERVGPTVRRSSVISPPVPSPAAATSSAARGGEIVVTINLPASRIELDGQVVARSVTRARLPVAAAGDHRLVVISPGRAPLVRTVLVSAGATVEVPIKLLDAKPRARQHGDYLMNPFQNRED